MATYDFSPGDVVVVPFPYSDRFAEKRRPALVVSNDEVSAQGFVWVVMITSSTHRAARHDVTIDDLGLAGLTAPSLVRPIKIACLEPARIIRKAGRLDKRPLARILESIRGFVG